MLTISDKPRSPKQECKLNKLIAINIIKWILYKLEIVMALNQLMYPK